MKTVHWVDLEGRRYVDIEELTEALTDAAESAAGLEAATYRSVRDGLRELRSRSGEPGLTRKVRIS